MQPEFEPVWRGRKRAAPKFLGPWTEQMHRNEEQSRTLATLRDTLLQKVLS